MLNFIERYRCRAKWVARGNCEYDFEELKATVPEALAPVSNAPHPRLLQLGTRAINAGMQYGVEKFKKLSTKSRRRVADKSKW